MVNTNTNAFFISEKIAKIRWVPEKLQESVRFITGSWDMGPSNFVRIWQLKKNQYADELTEYVPRCCDKVPFQGDINGIEFLTEDMAAVSCSDGHITVLNIKRAVEEDSLHVCSRSQLLHYFSNGDNAPCTALSVYGKDIVTVGEDGRLNIIDTLAMNTVKRTVKADSCALTAVRYVNPQEVITANRMGAIRIFDIRSPSKIQPTHSFLVSCEDEKRLNYVSSFTSHPTQSHIVLTGSEEGSLSVWDLRQPGYPASYFTAHSGPITEVSFHHTEPSRLFTASECGELWLWSQSQTVGISNSIDNTEDEENMNPWLNGERAKNRTKITALISKLRNSINSFDSQTSKIICSSDSEAIYFLDNIH